ncbi:hypothetical protein SCB17_003049 [Clostridium perfringens]|nr:hypothetical protein [Clostridium perfringens]
MKSIKIKLSVILISSTILSTSFVPLKVFANERCNNSTTNSYKEIMMEAAEKSRESKNLKEFDFKKYLIPLNEKELNLIKSEAETNEKLNLLIKELYDEKVISSKEYEIVNPSKIIGEDYEVQVLNLLLNKDVNITFIKLNNDCFSIANKIYKENNEITFKIYGLDEQNKLNLVDTVKYDNEKDVLVKKMPKRVKRGVKVYGNWCGPGHSGPGAPVDEIDACCKKHDYCYDSSTPKRACDIKLANCLAPIYPNTTYYGKTLITAIIGAFGLLNILDPYRVL